MERKPHQTASDGLKHKPSPSPPSEPHKQIRRSLGRRWIQPTASLFLAHQNQKTGTVFLWKNPRADARSSWLWKSQFSFKITVFSLGMKSKTEWGWGDGDGEAEPGRGQEGEDRVVCFYFSPTFFSFHNSFCE